MLWNKFKQGGELQAMLEEMSVDKFTDGYEACVTFAEEKGLDTLVIQLADYVEASVAKEAVKAKSVEPNIIVEDFTHAGMMVRGRTILSTLKLYINF